MVAHLERHQELPIELAIDNVDPEGLLYWQIPIVCPIQVDLAGRHELEKSAEVPPTLAEHRIGMQGHLPSRRVVDPSHPERFWQAPAMSFGRSDEDRPGGG